MPMLVIRYDPPKCEGTEMLPPDLSRTSRSDHPDRMASPAIASTSRPAARSASASGNPRPRRERRRSHHQPEAQAETTSHNTAAAIRDQGPLHGAPRPG